jgi:hypothetical protein
LPNRAHAAAGQKQSGFQRLHQAGGQHRQAVFFAFALAHHHLRLLKVNILDAQAQAFHQAQAAAVQQTGHQLVQPLHPAQYLVHFSFGEYGWQVLGRLARRA